MHSNSPGLLVAEVSKLLGTTKSLSAQTSEEFHEKCAPYMQSAQLRDDAMPPSFWPIVKKFKILCNSQALSSGAVLVDLPGVGDANAARCAVAEQYIKTCECVFIVSQVTRVSDDKNARGKLLFFSLLDQYFTLITIEILGSSMRNQLISTFNALFCAHTG